MKSRREAQQDNKLVGWVQVSKEEGARSAKQEDKAAICSEEQSVRAKEVKREHLCE